MKPDFIFISGVSRTGSTLLLRILNNSSEIAICRENYFLGHQLLWEGLRHVFRRKVGDLSDDANVHRLADLVYSGEFKRGTHAYWPWLRRHTDQEVFLEKLLAAPERSDRTLFRIMMELHGDWARQSKGNSADHLILGEKTPSHIYYVPTLLEWYPNSRIIHTFRDPRGIFASELRRRKKHPVTFPYKQLHWVGFAFTFYILLQVTYTWLRAAKLHFKYEKLYSDRYFLSKFEDLVTQPEMSIKRLCDFLEVEFEEEMAEQKVVSRGFSLGQGGFDRRAADRWRELNPPWVNTWFRLWGSKYLEALNYPA